MNISINGVETNYPDETISYDDIAAFVAIEEQWHPPLPLLSVVYSWKGPEDASRSGTLYPGKPAIKVAQGMYFTAVRTGNA